MDKGPFAASVCLNTIFFHDHLFWRFLFVSQIETNYNNKYIYCKFGISARMFSPIALKDIFAMLNIRD